MDCQFLPDKVDIYISYTRRVKKDKEIAEAFYRACEEHPRLQPHIDSEDLGLHADIYKYMDKLSAARFVVCVLSKEYFESINCVSEFAGLCHNGFMHERVFPLFIDFFFDDEKRNHWMRALEDSSEAKKRVEKNTGRDLSELLETGIWQLMEKLARFVRKDSSKHAKDNFKSFIEHFLEQIRHHNQDRQQNHLKKLEAGIQKSLNHPDLKGLLSRLSYILECENSSCAGTLLRDPIEGLAGFHQFCRDNNLLAPPVKPAREIAGFLFVATIDSDWWLMNEFSLQRGLSRGKFSETNGINQYSIEIVFSRVADRPAIYKKKEDKVYSESSIDCPAIPPFTGEPEVRKDVLLKSFYENRRQVPIYESRLDEEKMRTLRGDFKNDLHAGKQPFYIIPQEEFNALNKAGIIDEINKELENLVVFVVVGEDFHTSSSANVIAADVDRVQSFIHEFAIG